MPLPTFLQRSPKEPASDRRKSAPGPSPDEQGPAQAARTRARRRMMGAVVLLLAGVIGFPLLFETQPRPIGLDVPIQSASSPARSPASPQPVAVAPLPRVDAPPAAPLAPPQAAAQVVPQADAAAREAAASAPRSERAQAPAAAAPASAPAASRTSAAGPSASAPATAVATARPKAPAESAAAPRLASPGASQPASARAAEESDGRFVVQVGAYTDAGALREARSKVERLGLKTYTQVIETAAGKRTRVRVGPFEDRADAEGAARKLKAAGLPANILAL